MMNKILLAKYRALSFFKSIERTFLKAMIHIMTKPVAKVVNAQGDVIKTAGKVDMDVLVSLIDAPSREIQLSSVAKFTHEMLCRAYRAAVIRCQSESIEFDHWVRLEAVGNADLRASIMQKIEVITQMLVLRGRELGFFFHNVYSSYKVRCEASLGRVLDFKGHTAYSTFIAKLVAVSIVYLQILTGGIIRLLHLSKVISARGRVLDIEKETMNSTCEGTANAAPGEVINATTTIGEEHSASADSTSTEGFITGRIDEFHYSLDVDATTGADLSAVEEHMNTSSNVDARIWSMPILENGVLYIRQAYDVVQNEEVLEVI